MSSAHEYFHYLPRFRLHICRSCLYAVWPREVGAHLKGPHHELSSSEARAVTADLTTWSNLCRSPIELELPEQLQEALPYLPTYTDGLRCRLSDGKCSYVSRTVDSLENHWRIIHKWSADECRGGSGAQRRNDVARRQAAASKGVCCQRLFRTGALSKYVEVPATATESTEPAEEAESELTTALDELRALREKRRQQGEIVTATGSAKEVSPWLQFTRWPVDLQGHKLSEVAALAALPRWDEEPFLTTLCESIDRIVEEGYRSVCNDRINAFDQVRIKSFLQRPRAAD